MQKELEKLVACRGKEKLTLAEVKQLIIPNLTDDAFQLASAIADLRGAIARVKNHNEQMDRSQII